MSDRDSRTVETARVGLFDRPHNKGSPLSDGYRWGKENQTYIGV
ncbi:hypothetical protein V0288_14265 [Pannus brasiliensis CCIBt3594]|uniref:Uncharacterized protein n=1 Tax=Pannus brasiliensis CCIBt3594 TaxID=1427578 RepID=A0AAW9QN30_9CHRO